MLEIDYITTVASTVTAAHDLRRAGYTQRADLVSDLGSGYCLVARGGAVLAHVQARVSATSVDLSPPRTM